VETTQTARLGTEYIMTLCAEMDPPQRIDEMLSIFNVTGGWAKGPKINATVIQPPIGYRVCPMGRDGSTCV
jgi:hypothetical protein